MNQKEVALQDLKLWLSDERELGTIPEKIEVAGHFVLYGLNYYSIKYKKDENEEWLLGVAGGYEEDSTEHCGHVFSKMEVFDEKTAEEKSIEMVDMIRAYWMEQAKKAEENQRERIQNDQFLGFVLLANAEWDWNLLKMDLEEQWYIPVETEEKEDALIFKIQDMQCVVSLIPERIPNQEAEINASNNVLWSGAIEAAKAHQAHLIVSVKGANTMVEKGKLWTEILSCCSIQPNVLGIYASGTVFEPGFYEDAASLLKENNLPIYNWIHFGMYRTEKGLSGYTYGMKQFGFKEMEVLNTLASPEEIQEFLANLVYYVLENNAELHDQETIGFTQGQKLKIVEIDSEALNEKTLMIEYPD